MNAGADRRTFLALLPAGAFLSSWAQASGAEADPVYAAMEAHRQAYDAMADAWSATESVTGLYTHRETDPDAEAQLRRISSTENAEEDAFKALLAVRPTTRAGAIAAVAHVADIGFCPDEVRVWLAMLLKSPARGGADMSADSVQSLKSALEESGGTDKLVAVAEQRIMEHKETLRVSTDRVQLLGALAGIEVCKIVVETFASKGTLH